MPRRRLMTHPEQDWRDPDMECWSEPNRCYVPAWFRWQMACSRVNSTAVPDWRRDPTYDLRSRKPSIKV